MADAAASQTEEQQDFERRRRTSDARPPMRLPLDVDAISPRSSPHAPVADATDPGTNPLSAAHRRSSAETLSKAFGLGFDYQMFLDSQSLLNEEERAGALRIFRSIDSGTGQVDRNGILHVVTQLGMNMTDGELAGIMGQIDASGTGKVCFSDFCRFLEMWKEAQLIRVWNDDELADMNSQRIAVANAVSRGVLTDTAWRSASYLLLMVCALWYWWVVLREENSARNFSDTTVVLILESCMNVLFVVDVCITCRTARVVNGALLKGRSSVMRYAQTWLVIDFVSSLPFDLVIVLCGGAGSDLWRAARYCRLLRVLRVTSYFERSERAPVSKVYVQFHYTFRQYAVIFFWCAAGIHCLAEMWVALKQHSKPDERYAYITAVYWVVYTLSTVGYGDVEVETKGQHAFATGMFVLAMVFNASVIARVSEMMSQSDVDGERSRRMRETLALLEQVRVPPRLRTELLSFQAYLLNREVSESLERCIAAMPPSMQESVSLYARLRLLGRLPFLAGAQHDMQGCMWSIAQSLRRCIAQPDECLCVAGGPASCMFFIMYGFADVLNRDGGWITIVGTDHGFFGERALLTADGVRTATVKAITYMDLYRLDIADFDAILRRYPRFSETLQRPSELRPHGLPSPKPLNKAQSFAWTVEGSSYNERTDTDRMPLSQPAPEKSVDDAEESNGLQKMRTEGTDGLSRQTTVPLGGLLSVRTVDNTPSPPLSQVDDVAAVRSEPGSPQSFSPMAARVASDLDAVFPISPSESLASHSRRRVNPFISMLQDRQRTPTKEPDDGVAAVELTPATPAAARKEVNKEVPKARARELAVSAVIQSPRRGLRAAAAGRGEVYATAAQVRVLDQKVTKILDAVENLTMVMARQGIGGRRRSPPLPAALTHRRRSDESLL
eukprot:TRINITY_DN20063_c0_g1_i1.p1 TRINITY_DN20063_c0_g1~~TRINITY_DN20063_c0_g1_i1.p1  ORF type:complete len:916 (+),score=215.86 TRINITY_DN20063_c0_g1_i1:57-2750(+)